MHVRLPFTILITLLLAVSVNGYSYSCEEVKYQLINTGKSISASYVCVVPSDMYAEFNVMRKVYAQSDAGTFSFNTISSGFTTPFCANSTSPTDWQIISDEGYEIDCTDDFTLILDSEEPHISESEAMSLTITASTGIPRTIVSADSGIDITSVRCTSPNSTVIIYSGVGRNEKEGRFLLASWPCTGAPEVMTVLESVITIYADDYQFRYSTHVPQGHTVSATQPVQVISSGKSGDVQNLDRESNVAFFSWGSYHNLLVETEVTFDSVHPGTLEIHYYTISGTQIKHIKAGTAAETVKHAYSAEVYYIPTQLEPEQIGASSEQFFVQISFPDSGPATSTATPDASTGEYCNCAVDKNYFPVDWDSNGIWLDVVIVLDTSEAMGEASLRDAISLIDSFIGDEKNDVLLTDPIDAFYTRIGVIAMADEPEILYNMNMTKNDFVSATTKRGVSLMNVTYAFDEAIKMLDNGAMNNPREKIRQVVYFATNSETDGNFTKAKRFKSTNGVIIVNNFKNEGDGEKRGLEDLASEGYYHDDIRYNYMQTIQLFCKANCYCTSDKIAYAGANPDVAIQAAGGCYITSNAGIPFSKAEQSCEISAGGMLAPVHDDHKNRFIHDLMAQSTSFNYWIGYYKDQDGTWIWEDDSDDSYTNWGTGEPSHVAVAKCAYVDPTTLTWGAGNCQIGFPYACQYAPCTVGHKNC